MVWLFAVSIGLLMGCGTYLVLRARGFAVALGLMLLTYATNFFVFAAGGITVARAPVKGHGTSVEQMVDPLPQALVLTAIVIGLAMTALMLVLILRVLSETGTERVDTQRGEEER